MNFYPFYLPFSRELWGCLSKDDIPTVTLLLGPSVWLVISSSRGQTLGHELHALNRGLSSHTHHLTASSSIKLLQDNRNCKKLHLGPRVSEWKKDRINLHCFVKGAIQILLNWIASCIDPGLLWCPWSVADNYRYYYICIDFFKRDRHLKAIWKNYSSEVGRLKCPGAQRGTFSPHNCQNVTVFTRTHARTHAHTHTHTHARTHICTRTHTRTHARTHTDARMHARTHTRTHTHTWQHVHMWVIFELW